MFFSFQDTPKYLNTETCSKIWSWIHICKSPSLSSFCLVLKSIVFALLWFSISLFSSIHFITRSKSFWSVLVISVLDYPVKYRLVSAAFNKYIQYIFKNPVSGSRIRMGCVYCTIKLYTSNNLRLARCVRPVLIRRNWVEQNLNIASIEINLRPPFHSFTISKFAKVDH